MNTEKASTSTLLRPKKHMKAFEITAVGLVRWDQNLADGMAITTDNGRINYFVEYSINDRFIEKWIERQSE